MRFPPKDITIPQCICRVGKLNPYCVYTHSETEDSMNLDIYSGHEAEQSAKDIS